MRGAIGFAAFALFAGAVQYAYCEGSRAWALHGGTSYRLLYLEYPLFVALAWTFVPPARERGLGRAALERCAALAAVLLLYVLLDGAAHHLHRSARFQDLALLGALIAYSPRLGAAALALLGFGLVLPLLRAVLLARRAPAGLRRRWFLRRVLLWASAGLFFASPLGRGYVEGVLPFADWSERRSLQLAGRFAALLHYGYRRAEALARLAALGPPAEDSPRFAGVPAQARNLHLILLESFLDPRLVRGARFRGAVLDPELAAFLRSSGPPGFDFVRVPVYGGGSAQTEFEVLTGLPALARVSPIEFLCLEGHAVRSFCARLRAAGYRTVATVAGPRGFFNAELAYESLGFDEVRFAGDDPELRPAPGDQWLFDGDLFAATLRRLERDFLARGKPVFDYVVGVYGHTPFQRNRSRRPDLVSVDRGGPHSAALARIANQFRYRTRALARFLKRLRRLDPDALVLVLSDHLPPIFGRGLAYARDERDNLALLFDRGGRVPLPARTAAYELPYLLWSRLTGRPCPVPPRPRLERSYRSLLARGLGLLPPAPRRR